MSEWELITDSEPMDGEVVLLGISNYEGEVRNQNLPVLVFVGWIRRVWAGKMLAWMSCQASWTSMLIPIEDTPTHFMRIEAPKAKKEQEQ